MGGSLFKATEEPSKSCVLICVTCLAIVTTLTVTTGVAVVTPKFIVKLYHILPNILQPANVKWHQANMRPKPDRTTPVTNTTTTTTTTTKKVTNATTTTPKPTTKRIITPPPRPSRPIKDLFKAGVGIADITGPILDFAFMGHMDTSQVGKGLHTRQFSRAFCFSENKKKVVYVVVEMYAVGYNIRNRVIKALNGKRKEYSITNVHIAASGTYNAPGCHLAEYMYGLGPPYSEECTTPYVNGITHSIKTACGSMVPAHLFHAETEIFYIQKNRSPWAFTWNEAHEIEESNIDFDYNLVQLRVENKYYDVLGVINWAAVRSCTLPYTNSLVSTGIMGYAAQQLEKHLNPDRIAGQPKIIAAFALSNHGDLTPNIDGGKCDWNRAYHACTNSKDCTWGWAKNLCVLKRDYYFDDVYHQCRQFGIRLYNGGIDALKIGTELRGFIEARFITLHDAEKNATAFDFQNLKLTETEIGPLCYPPFMGAAWRPLPIDSERKWPEQGVLDDVWKKLYYVGATPAKAPACHDPKSIRYSTGKSRTRLHPYEWTMSVLNLGGLLVACLPGEVTTMAGRRIRKVMKMVIDNSRRGGKIVLSGHTNEYIFYIPTKAEYNAQFHEGAMTMQGPETLDLIIYGVIVTTQKALTPSKTISHSFGGLSGEDNYHLRTTNVFKTPPINIPPHGHQFAEVLTQPPLVVKKGDTVTTKYVISNPRVNLRHNESFVIVEKDDAGNWSTVFTDSDWDTKFSIDYSTNQGTFTWKILDHQAIGKYRQRYFGFANSKEYVGTTVSFTIRPQ